jgi:putative ABC transport system permease protein
MKSFFRLLPASIAQAWHELRSNALRSVLSLLGITIGIFCIMSIKSAVDSLEYNIRKSFEKLGDDVLYVTKQPWNEDPSMNWWKYVRRPDPNFADYRAVRANSPGAELSAFSIFLGRKPVKFGSNVADNAYLVAATEDYARLFNVQLSDGRFYSPVEYATGSKVAVIGSQVADILFGGLDPIDKEVRLLGHRVRILGVIEPSGKDLIKVMDFDRAVLISYPLARSIANVRESGNYGGGMIAVKADPAYQVEEVVDQVIGAMRVSRRLSPRMDNNFAVNEMSILTQILEQFFRVLNLAGFSIGIFALFVGMFSVANIMFVSVKERTAQIGIKKALGARSLFILIEFLVEAVILCIVGGIAGLLLVLLVIKVIAAAADFPMYLSWQNVGLGIAVSAVIGILSGLIPAIQAARMDPVEAMRN